MNKIICKKLASMCVLLVFVTTFFCACTSAPAQASQPSVSSQPAQQSAPAQKKTLKYVIGTSHTARSLEYVIAAQDFLEPEIAKRVEAETNYKIEWVEAYGTTTKHPETLKAIQTGLLEFGFINFSPLAGQLPIYNFSMILPFTSSNPMIALEASNKIFEEFPVLKETLDKTFNQQFIALHGLADYGIYSTSKISSIGDMKGKKVGGSGRNLLWLENTGAVPVSSNLGDGYTSLQTKLIDAQFCAATWGLNYKYHEIAKHYTIAGLGSAPTICLTINNDVWKAMPDEVKAIVKEVANEWSVKSTQMSIDEESKSIETIKAQGAQVYKMTDAQKAEWAACLPNLPDTAAKELGKDGLIILERYLQILKEMGEPVAREWKFNY